MSKEDFGDFDMNSLLADNDLQAELRALGWKDDDSASAIHDNKQDKIGNKADLLAIGTIDLSEVNLDIESLGVIDDRHIALSENDMNDPELLRAYEELLPTNHQSRPTAIETETPQQPPNKILATPSPSVNEFEGVSSAEAKRRACQYKKEGNTDEALKWFRFAKKLDADASLKSSSNKPNSSSVAIAKIEVASMKKIIKNPFDVLEEAILQACDLALNSARSLRDKDPKLAAEEMREYKRLQQELTVLKSRQMVVGAQVPLFRWESIKKQEKIEYLELGENDLRLSIKSLSGLESVFKEHSSKTISINYNFGGGSKDTDIEGSTKQLTYDASKPLEINYSVILNCLKRGKVAQQSFSRKKINFEIVLHRGFFRSNLIIAVTSFSLQSLLEKCSCESEVPLYAAEIIDGVTKKGKALGGLMKVAVCIRNPILKPEVLVTEERKLIIDQWPEMTSELSTAQIVKENPSMEKKVAIELPYDDILTEQEKTDPDYVEFLESNDVLENEIEKVQASIAAASNEDDRMMLTSKLQLLSIRLQILVTQVQNETLTIEQYLEKLRNRVKRDQMIALYHKAKGDSMSLSIAINVLRRIKIMQSEIKNAEESMMEES